VAPSASDAYFIRHRPTDGTDIDPWPDIDRAFIDEA
jgi:hypothetical protein